MSGYIHFVTPTNRWIGRIPLSTLDPLTLEPFSTYLRQDETPPLPADNSDRDTTTNTSEKQCSSEENAGRTCNIMGQPVSLILARLQTTPQGCSCGCTEPPPPKHSDYYHAQHISRLIFQTQKVRPRVIKAQLPEYFERLQSDTDDQDTYWCQEGGKEGVDENGQHHRPEQPVDPTATPTQESLHQQHQQEGYSQQPHPTPQRRKGSKLPRHVHSLVQNHGLRNPLTNMETEGDPTFFVVLEAGKGGWWFEPWVMAMPTDVPDAGYSHVSRQDHKETGSISKEKERIRQERIVHLEKESQCELAWRRSQRSQTCSPKRPSKRMELGRDIVLLEPWEHGLRLPRRVEYPYEMESKESSGDNATCFDPSDHPQPTLEQGSTAQDDVGLKNSRQQQPKEVTNLSQRKALDRWVKDLHGSKKESSISTRTRSTLSPPNIMPWWDPDPQPFKMPSTQLSPCAISTLPEPVAKHFGGRSIYARASSSTRQRSPSPMSRERADREETDEVQAGDNQERSTDDLGPGKVSESSNRGDPESEPADTLIGTNTCGCQWVPVPQGDRVAVMIGTSRDFLLFPSFQRLIFRHMSREDFEDRVGRVGSIPCSVSAMVLEERRAHDAGSRRNGHRADNGAHPQLDAHRGERISHDAVQGNEQDASGQREDSSRLWTSWISRSSHLPTSRGTPNTRTMIEEPETIPQNASCGISPAPFPYSSNSGQERHQQVPTEMSPDGQTSSRNDGADNAKDESRRKEWESYRETLEREDYDSSDYYYSSTDDDDDHLVFDPDEFSDSDDSSRSSDDGNESSTIGRGDVAASSRYCWTLRDWIQLILFCHRPMPRTSSESRRARRRRLRRERWRQYQMHLQQQESLAFHRHLPRRLQQAMGPDEVHRCCMIAEFCRFYLTILMAMVIMGVIVYAAIQAETSPKDTQERRGDHHHNNSTVVGVSQSPARLHLDLGTRNTDPNADPRLNMGLGPLKSQTLLVDRGMQDKARSHGPGQQQHLRKRKQKRHHHHHHRRD